MKRTYLVLDKSDGVNLETFRGFAVGAGALPKAHTELMTASEALERSRNPQESVAEAMPMRLIEPRDRQVGGGGIGDGKFTWGVQAVNAHRSPFDGDGVTVAVLDTGIDKDYEKHPAFKGLVVTQQNFTAEGSEDQHGHGTHCAGTIFGRAMPDGLRIGVAPGVKQALIGKVLGAKGGSSDKIVEAILWAAQEGAHIISMSLGMDFPGLVARLIAEDGMPPELATSVALEGYRANVLLFSDLAALLSRRTKSTLLIAAAGNESRRKLNPNFKINVAPPAVSDGIVSVAAVGQESGKLFVADFSNTGASVCAPGVGIASAGRGGGLETMSGTSMATPHVAGVAALWAQKLMRTGGGNLSIDELASRVKGSAVLDAVDLDPRDVGTGIVCAPAS